MRARLYEYKLMYGNVWECMQENNVLLHVRGLSLGPKGGDLWNHVRAIFNSEWCSIKVLLPNIESWAEAHRPVECVRSMLHHEWRHDRIFIAGDAAHQTPPFLGQGMNTGMRDVINLAWKLPLVLNDECAGNLLDTYQAERKDHAHDLVSWAVDMGHLMEHIAAAEATERRGEKPPPAQQKSKKSGYGQGRELPPIRSGVVLSEQVSDDGATGYLLPQPLIRDTGGKQCRFDELLGPHFALLTMGPAVVNKASAAVLNALRVKAIDVSTLELVQGKFPELLTAGEALLLRPDRIVFGHTDDKTSIDMLCSKLASAIAVK